MMIMLLYKLTKMHTWGWTQVGLRQGGMGGDREPGDHKGWAGMPLAGPSFTSMLA